MELKYEFDSFEEVQEAMKNLSEYHDCKKCHGKLVYIGNDEFGNSTCGYCGQVVKYPKLSQKGYKFEKEKWGKKYGIKT